MRSFLLLQCIGKLAMYYSNSVMSDVPQAPTSLVDSRVRPIVGEIVNYNHHNNNYMVGVPVIKNISFNASAQIAPTWIQPVLVQAPTKIHFFNRQYQVPSIQRIQSVCDLCSSKLHRYPVHPTVLSESQNLLLPSSPSNDADCTSCSKHLPENDASLSSNPLYENNQKITHNSILNGEIINDNHYLLDTVYPSPMNIGSLPHIPPIMQELEQTMPPVDSLPPSPSELYIVLQDHDEFDEMKDCEKFNTTSYSLEVQTTGREGFQRLPFEDFTTSPDNLISSSNSSTLFSSCSSISSSNCTVHDLASTLESPLPSPTSSPPPLFPISPPHSPSLSLPISIPFSKAVPQSFTFLPSPSPSPSPTPTPIPSLLISIPIKVWLKARKRRRKNSRRNSSSSATSLIKPKLDTQNQKDVIIIDDDVANKSVLSQDLNANTDTNSSAVGTSTEEKNEVLKKLEEIFQDSPLLSEKDATIIKGFLTGKTIHLPKPLMRYALRQVISSEGVLQYACMELDVQNKQWRGIRIDANSIAIHNDNI